MTNKNETPPKGSTKPATETGGPKKPSALLDLTATEIASKETKPGGADSRVTPESAVKKIAGDAAPPKTAVPTGPATATPAGPSQPSQAGAQGAAPKPPPRPDVKPGDGRGPQSGTPAAQTPGRSGGGIGRMLTHLAAGVAGGFLALLLADSIGPRLGIGPGGPPPGLADLQKRVSAAEQILRERASSTQTASLEQKLAALESRLTGLNDLGRTVGEVVQTQARLAGETKGLEERLQQSTASGGAERLARLEHMLATLTAAAGAEQPGGRIPQLAAITGKLADLESTIPNQLAELRKSVAQELETRLAHTAEAGEAARSATQRMDRDLAASRADLARLAQRAESLRGTDERLEQGIRALQEEAGTLRSSLEATRSDLAAQLKSVARSQDLTAAVAPLSNRMATLEQSLQGVVKSEEDRKANAERIVLALELGNLKRALDRGGSYSRELAELRRVADGKIDLSVLKRYEEQGVPTLPELAREFRPLADAIVDRASAPADASTWDRLVQGAKSVVRVRRIEHAPDDRTAEAIVGRMEKALAGGKLIEVLEDAKGLPAKAIEPAAPWLAKVEARAGVDRALAAVEDQLKASLSGKTPVEKRTQ